MAVYAKVIVDLSLDKLDRPFSYLVPEELERKIFPGTMVDIPFGRRQMRGFVIGLTDSPGYDEAKIRPISGIDEKGVAVESELIALAFWMRSCYGSTMNQALKTVLPVSKKTKPAEHKTIVLQMESGQARRILAQMEQKNQRARARLLRELIDTPVMDYDLVIHKLNVSSAVIRGMAEKGILAVEKKRAYRNPVNVGDAGGYHLRLNPGQQYVVDEILKKRENPPAAYLIHGVTGSGKTEVYMELIARTIEKGRKAIVLIPEIALTYQTLRRFYGRFGDRVSILNSRMSQGEKYDQYLRAKNGRIDIMIGPRSALFTPFADLGIIIIDEEHESSYKSETAPRYHARETAIHRAKSFGAKVVLGSATPSVDSFYRAKKGEFLLLTMDQRVEEKPLPKAEVIDLRAELKNGNRSILSRRLQELMKERLERKEQIMLFLNRRGISSFVSCRACGTVIRCPHCDVSLSRHNHGRMICHYCGYREPEPKVCPACGSKYIAGFKAGTQKVEEIVKEQFPGARILRMDYDTTRTKNSYEKILDSFMRHEADILIGTQMIVKGHDFPLVTLVGVLAADLSLHISDHRATERTFQLLTQAIGRAGRGDLPGEAVIQTYEPDNFAVQAAKDQDYEAFYRREIAYRKLMRYPPVSHLLMIAMTGKDRERLGGAAEEIAARVRELAGEKTDSAVVLGPADAVIGKISDVYRMLIYVKSDSYRTLVAVKDGLDAGSRSRTEGCDVSVQYNFDPMNGM